MSLDYQHPFVATWSFSAALLICFCCASLYFLECSQDTLHYAKEEGQVGWIDPIIIPRPLLSLIHDIEKCRPWYIIGQRLVERDRMSQPYNNINNVSYIPSTGHTKSSKGAKSTDDKSIPLVRDDSTLPSQQQLPPIPMETVRRGRVMVDHIYDTCQ